MKKFHLLILVVVVVAVVVFIIANPGTRGPGLKGIIHTPGRGPTWATQAAGKVFVSETVSSDLAVYSIASGAFEESMMNIPDPGFSIYSRKVGKLFVSSGTEGNGSLVIIDPNTLKAETQIRLGVESRGAAVSPDGKYLYAIWGGLREGPGLLTKIRLSDYDIKAFVNTRESPTAIIVGPDGKKVYVASHYGQRSLGAYFGEYKQVKEIRSVVEVFDVTAEDEMKSVKEIEVGLKPESMAAYGNGRYIIVAATAFENENLKLPSFSIIDTLADKVIEEIHTPGYAPFIVVVNEKLDMAYATFLYKKPIPEGETTEESAAAPESDSGTPAEGDKQKDDEKEVKPKYYVFYGKGFLAVNLKDYNVDIYADKRNLPLGSLCVLDDGRLIGISPEKNAMAIIEPQT